MRENTQNYLRNTEYTLIFGLGEFKRRFSRISGSTSLSSGQYLGFLLFNFLFLGTTL
jgi:hypothetical protein